MIELAEYDLADAPLIASCKVKAASRADNLAEEHHVVQYLHPITAVVIGASNKAESSVIASACLDDGVPVIQRPSGGEAVVISPRTLLFSHIMLGSQLPRSRDYFMLNLEVFQTELAKLGVRNLRFNGISDLCIGQKKILGCAIYRRPGMVLFQAVLNLAESPALIARYLAPPSRMPDYRQGRPHEEFVTSLEAEAYQIKAEDLDLPAAMKLVVKADLFAY